MKSEKQFFSIRGKIVWFIILLALWELIALSGVFSPVLFPDLKAIVSALIEAFRNGSLAIGTIKSLVMAFLGIIAGFAGALLMAVGALYSRKIQLLADMLTGVFHPLPGIALFPIMILFSGLELSPCFL